jgi:hypothetical protein
MAVIIHVDEFSRMVKSLLIYRNCTIIAGHASKHAMLSVDRGKIILFGEESVARLAKRFGLAARPVIKAF